MPAGCVFADKGPAAFVAEDSPDQMLALLGVATSAAFCYLVELQMAFGSYEVGVIQRTPVPNLTDDDTDLLARLARRAWSRKRALDTVNETSHAFLLPPGLNEQVSGLDLDAVEREFQSIQCEIDDAAFRLYDIGPEDRAAIEAASKRATTSAGEAEPPDDEGDDDVSDDAAPVAAAADALVSWLVGVAFGRFDPRLATGARAIPPEPEPFDPLPARSPGMWPESDDARLTPPDLWSTTKATASTFGTRRARRSERRCARPRRSSCAGSRASSSRCTSRCTRRAVARRRSTGSSRRPRRATRCGSTSTPSRKDTLFRVQNDYVAPEARARGAPARVADAASCATERRPPSARSSPRRKRSSRSCARSSTR